VHLRGRSLGLVFAGGSVGTAARYGLSRLVLPVSGVPVGTLAVNVVGAFVLGLLLERLARTGPDDGRRRDLRLGVGTGVLGGFTTYSALATDTASLLSAGRLAGAAGYAFGTLVLGLLAAATGIWVAGRGARGPR
jgi:CrcB protein